MAVRCHFHDGSSCHDDSTLDECIEYAVKRRWEGRVLERDDKGTKCYSLICDKFNHWSKYGRWVAELKLEMQVRYL